MFNTPVIIINSIRIPLIGRNFYSFACLFHKYPDYIYPHNNLFIELILVQFMDVLYMGWNFLHYSVVLADDVNLPP